MKNEINNNGYGPGRDLTNTLLTKNSYSVSNINKIKDIINKMENQSNKDTYVYSEKVVDGKIGGIPVDEIPDNYNRNQGSEKILDNIEMYNSISKHNNFKLIQHMNKK